MCATRRLKSSGGERPSPAGPSQRSGEAEDSLSRETPGRVGAVLTTPGRASTARWCGPGQQDGKVYVRNQCSTPLNGPPAQIWRIWVGRGAHPLPAGGWGTPVGDVTSRPEATVNVCGVTVAMPQVELDTSLVDRLRDERGNRPASPSPPCSQRGGRAGPSSADGTEWGGGFVVVGGRESRSQGEGSQQVSGGSAGRPGGRL